MAHNTNASILDSIFKYKISVRFYINIKNTEYFKRENILIPVHELENCVLENYRFSLFASTTEEEIAMYEAEYEHLTIGLNNFEDNKLNLIKDVNIINNYLLNKSLIDFSAFDKVELRYTSSNDIIVHDYSFDKKRFDIQYSEIDLLEVISDDIEKVINDSTN